MILLVDNYDSFTFNLYQYLGELGADVKVVRNDALSVDEALALGPERIVISPGPGTPDEAGISLELVRRSPVPLLGVCLGHQALGQAFGGKVVRAAEADARQDQRDPPRRPHHLRGPAGRVHRHALPLAGRGAGERPRVPRGLGLDRRRRRDGPAAPRAAARRRAVPPGEHPHHGGQGPAPELPRPRRQGEHQAPPHEARARRAAERGRGRLGDGRDHGRRRDARADRRAARGDGGARRDRGRGRRASRARCARGRSRSRRRAPSTPAAPAATGRAPSTSRPWRRSWSRPAGCRSPSTATARRAAPAARPTCSRRSGPDRRAHGDGAEGARRGGLDLPVRAALPRRDAPRGRAAQGAGRAHRLQPARARSRTRRGPRRRWSACRSRSSRPSSRAACSGSGRGAPGS